jgi:hypothetical protein
MSELAERKAKALAYENADVIESFRADHDVSLDEARALFEDTKKWLWLCGTRPRAMRMTVFGPMKQLDAMWHTFILFTREYTEYCMTHFGHYIHHAPTTRAERERAAGSAADVRAERRAMMLLLHDEFGEATLRRWFDRA